MLRITTVSCERESIPVRYSKRVPDLNWEYISPSGKRHVWVNGQVPTLKRRTKKIPEIAYVLDGECEWPTETGKYIKTIVYFDPETGKEVEPSTTVIIVDDFMPGIESCSCEFLWDKFIDIGANIDVSLCRYDLESDREYFKNVQGSWVITEIYYYQDKGENVYAGKAILTQ
ncbi:hypothetical protein M0R72_13905 [Candidatus Pacearchaeota archaeon]|jgi:hypothetical protein|nr:hypothetical protein [Candidatus Pacearchaeota archaeon]